MYRVEQIRHNGTLYVYIVTEGMDYALVMKDDPKTTNLFEGDIRSLIPEEAFNKSVRANIQFVKGWFDLVLEKDVMGELQTILGDILYMASNSKKLYLETEDSPKLKSCWRLWQCGNRDADLKVRRLITEVCKEGFTEDNLKRLYKAVDAVNFHNHAPYAKWYLKWISPDRDIVKVMCEERGENDSKYVMYLKIKSK